MKKLSCRAGRVFAEHPLAVLWTLGLVLRGLAAWFALGFFARDDYFHVLDIALSWIEDPSFDWDASNKAGAGIRSHLLPRVVQGLLLLAESLGITGPESQLRFVYGTMGAYSSLIVPGVWAAMRHDSPQARLYGTSLAAAHFVLPYAGTRLLIEATAMVPLVWGLAFTRQTLKGGSIWHAILGGLFIGLACWWRYQVGIMGLAMAAVLLWHMRFLAVLGLATGAAVALGAQGLFDWLTTGGLFLPLANNIAANLSPHDGLTRSGPFGYFGFWLALTLPPLSLFIIPLLFVAARRAPLVSISWLAFVVVHSMIPHKEERFMLPAVPLFLMLLGLIPDALDSSTGRFFALIRRWRRAAFGFFVAVHTAALLIACTAQTQANARDAMRDLRVDGQVSGLISMGPELQLFFLDRPELPVARVGKPDLVWLGRIFADMKRSHDIVPNRYLCFEPDCGTVELYLATLALSCEMPEVFSGFWADRLAYRLNPEHNRRRAPVWLYRCERPSLAMHSSRNHE